MNELKGYPEKKELLANQHPIERKNACVHNEAISQFSKVLLERTEVERIEKIIEKTSSFAPVNVLAQEIQNLIRKGE